MDQKPEVTVFETPKVEYVPVEPVHTAASTEAPASVPMTPLIPAKPTWPWP